MRVLMVHNYYQQHGGEDESTNQEIRLLARHGHTVRLYSRHNDEINRFSPIQKVGLFFEPTWSQRSYRQFLDVLDEFQPEVVHVQNFFALVSPSVFYASASRGVKVVFTLRDYRLLCPLGWFFRDGKVCEDCLSGSLWNSIRHSCYHNSRLQTASIALLLASHRALQTWQKQVQTFIALTEHSRQKFIQGGLDPEKIIVRPNFVETDPGQGGEDRLGAIFVGRLSVEKGLDTLLKAWEQLSDLPLKIVGDGPLRPWVEQQIQEHSLQQVQLVGFKPINEVLELVKKARLLVMPSNWYETFGRTIIEAYATGTPVIASRLGAMADLVQDGQTGLLFQPGDPLNLFVKVRAACENEQLRRAWGRNARRAYETRYSAENAYASIMEIYKK